MNPTNIPREEDGADTMAMAAADDMKTGDKGLAFSAEANRAEAIFTRDRCALTRVLPPADLGLLRGRTHRRFGAPVKLNHGVELFLEAPQSQ
jgi:hypothetical protein